MLTSVLNLKSISLLNKPDRQQAPDTTQFPTRRECGGLRNQDTSQGLQTNQEATFLTDDGEEIRALTEQITPESKHVLDCWGGRHHGIACQTWAVIHQDRRWCVH